MVNLLLAEVFVWIIQLEHKKREKKIRFLPMLDCLSIFLLDSYLRICKEMLI